MAKAPFNAGSLQHKETWYVLPDQVIVDESLNGRFEPHSEEDVRQRAIDMVIHGQLQPVGVRKAHDQESKPQLVFGFLRTKAALYINEVLLKEGEFEYEGQKKTVTQPFKLWIARYDGDSVESLKRNILENLSRKGTSVMDTVYNQERLRKSGQSEQEIAALYGVAVAVVQRNRNLLDLSKQIQVMIHRGIMPADAGFSLLTVSEDDRKNIVAGLLETAEASGQKFDASEQEFLRHVPGADTNHPSFEKKPAPVDAPAGAVAEAGEVPPVTGETASDEKAVKEKKPKKPTKIKASDVKTAVRKTKEAKGQKSDGRSRKNILDFFRDLDVPNADLRVKDFSKKFLAWTAGSITDKQMENALEKFGGVN